MAKSLDAMGACMNEMVKRWGLDPAVQQSLTRSATPLNYPGDWVTSDDYPTNRLRKGESAIVNFRVIVNAEGRVSSCVRAPRSS
jgi:hypothetical protein